MKEPVELEILCTDPEKFESMKALEKLGIEVEDSDDEENCVWENGMFLIDCFYPDVTRMRTIIYSGGTSFTCKLTYDELKKKLNL